MIRLLLGGTSSGKSGLAERLLLAGPDPHRAVVTGRALDADFRERIAAHKRARPARVGVIETGAEAWDVLAREAATTGGTLLFDSLDSWLFRYLEGPRSETAGTVLTQGLAPFAAAGAPELIVVSAEISLGPLPADAATRRFAGELATLNQKTAALAHDVRLVVAGLALPLKERRS